MAGLPSLSSVGHNIANVARAAVKGLEKVLGKVMELGKKPPESTSVANTASMETPVTTILGDRDIMNPGITGDIIEDYSGLDRTSAEKEKDELLEGLATKRQIGGGEGFSDEQIVAIKENASTKAGSVIQDRIKTGETPDRDGLKIIMGEALFEAMLELPQNAGLTNHQKEAAWADFRESVDNNEQKRISNPHWNIPDLMGVPRMQDHIDEQNSSALLDKATYPVMVDVRNAEEGDRPAIKGGQNGMIAQYVMMIGSLRSEDPDVASIDAKLGPKLMRSLSAEMAREEDSVEMTDEQFSALTGLYTDIYNSAESYTKEETEFFFQLRGHPRDRAS